MSNVNTRFYLGLFGLALCVGSACGQEGYNQRFGNGWSGQRNAGSRLGYVSPVLRFSRVESLKRQMQPHDYQWTEAGALTPSRGWGNQDRAFGGGVQKWQVPSMWTETRSETRGVYWSGI